MRVGGGIARYERVAKPGELVFEFLVGHDRYRCELRDHVSEFGVEAQFFVNDDFRYGHCFDMTRSGTRTPREMAIAWAEEERKDLKKGSST